MAHTVEQFWTPDRVLPAIVFVLGLLIGGFATNQYIDPFLSGTQAQDQNSLLEMNARLDARNDQLYYCLVDNNVPQSACIGAGAANPIIAENINN